jgi:hypothetical protein
MKWQFGRMSAHNKSVRLATARLLLWVNALIPVSMEDTHWVSMGESAW